MTRLSAGYSPSIVCLRKDHAVATKRAASSKRDVPPLTKAKGVAQMAAGAALTCAGVPMCVLPGPGMAAIAGGMALASKGQRNFSGREATAVERKLDEAAAKAAAVAKREARKAARAAGDAAKRGAKAAARAAANSAKAAWEKRKGSR